MDIPTYIPYLTNVFRRVMWYDHKARKACEDRNFTLQDISQVFKDPKRIVGLAEIHDSVLYTKNKKEVFVKEDRYFLVGNKLIVFFVLNNEWVQVINCYKFKDKKSWERLIRFAGAFRAVPEIVDVEDFNHERWLHIATTPHGVIAHEIIANLTQAGTKGEKHE